LSRAQQQLFEEIRLTIEFTLTHEDVEVQCFLGRGLPKTVKIFPLRR